ncbi:Gustatory Receptor 1 [Frankliniella occidentalis]|uniref:Gustatory receptor n=1 Tax=Frankliniella occidentalis TaxID=133901 RepID=A0A9C6XCK2_FRAOC|nr:gustatory and odorant receptor 24-like isoform X2 [Frankliniella occidentalis]KAE8751358.1 Gustatory Receptor 1 [Frankliniella occidentalis]
MRHSSPQGRRGAMGGHQDRVLSLAQEMKPILLVMRGINIMPLRFLADGGVTCFAARSPLAALSAALWALTVVDALVEVRERAGLVRGAAEFSDAVFQIFFLMLVHHHFLTPVLHWRAAPAFADYLSDWKDYQDTYLAVTGRPLRLGVRPLASHKGAAAVAVPLLLAVALLLTFDGNNWHNTLLGLMAATFHAVIPSFWDVLGTAVVNASDTLSRHLEEEVFAAGGAPEPGRVRAYRDLWLGLRELAERATATWGACTIHYLLCCVSAVLLNGFGLMAEATEGADANLLMASAMLLITVDSLWHTAVVCGAGHRMAASVGGGARDVLLAMRTSGESSPHRAHRARSRSLTTLQTEVASFLKVMQRPTIVTLYGFITLRLTLIVTIMDKLVTYLCVLLQFTINFRLKYRNHRRRSP